MPWPGSKGSPQGGECCGRLRRRAVSATAAISEQPSTAELTRTKSRSRMTVRPARLRRSRLVSATRPILGSEFPEHVDDLPLHAGRIGFEHTGDVVEGSRPDFLLVVHMNRCRLIGAHKHASQ